MKMILSELKNILILDGAMGTELINAGMTDAICPELWMLQNPDVPVKIQEKYISAGAKAILAPTFGANSAKLAEFGIKNKTIEINQKLVQISKEAAKGKKIFIGGDIGPTGKMISPAGDLPFESAVEIFKEQVKALADAGVDFFMIETMLDIQEARAALIAIKESSNLPSIVSMTFSDSARTLSGTPPCAAVVTLQALGADAVGANCSLGPDLLIPVVREMKKYAKVPISVKPNAGLPKLVNGKTLFDMPPSEFAIFAEKLVIEGASIVGGCCGSSPEHIKALSKKLKPLQPVHPEPKFKSVISSSRMITSFTFDTPLRIIGERINPTGKKKLKEELLAGSFKELRRLAAEQEMKGANVLDVNVGAPGCDELKTLPIAVSEATSVSHLPICLDSSDPEAIEATLRIYPGRALINSISFESKKISKLIPAAKKYGAMFILLPLGDGDLPEDSETRIKYIKKIYSLAAKHGFTKDDIIIDGLVLTVSSNPKAPTETLKTIKWAKKNGFNSVIGLSNVSFGLPAREKINAAFLSMAISNGLSAAIINPENEDVISAKFASDALCGKDDSCANFVSKFQDKTTLTVKNLNTTKPQSHSEIIRNAILKGDRNHIAEFTQEAISSGSDPFSIANDVIIPAIREVGDLYNSKIYFMPQLIMSAETVKKAFEILDPLLEKDTRNASKAKKKILLATVKGDIHDIGKNIVALVLKNHGYDVIDLGKDIPPEEIASIAKKKQVDAIGLSALMTTTMPTMRKTIETCRSHGINVKFIIGGAVVDSEFADSIGAHYAKDAVDAVKTLDKILKEKQ